MKFFTNYKNQILLSIIFILLMPIFVGAAGSVTIANPLGTSDFQALITKLLNVVFSIVGLVAIVMIVYGGFQIMISGGEEKKYEQAKKTITYAVVGLVVVILSYSILNFIVSAFG